MSGSFKKYRRNLYQKNKAKIMDIFGGKCQKCGCSDKRVLEFHHLTKKDSEKDYLKEEYRLSLILLCANCHKILHYLTRTHQKREIKKFFSYTSFLTFPFRQKI